MSDTSRVYLHSVKCIVSALYVGKHELLTCSVIRVSLRRIASSGLLFGGFFLSTTREDIMGNRKKKEKPEIERCV